jgi:hypothetical protein
LNLPSAKDLCWKRECHGGSDNRAVEAFDLSGLLLTPICQRRLFWVEALLLIVSDRLLAASGDYKHRFPHNADKIGLGEFAGVRRHV